ncbi:MAG: prenyltransferase [Anaerolineae bacterium]|nr:prenyltransferase [Anaerolineae bacterium]
MKLTPLETARIFTRTAQPWSLLGGILFYALGVGVAHYLGEPLDWRVYWLGQACITMLQVSSFYLKHYFDLPPYHRNDPKRDAKPITDLPKPAWLQAAITTLTVDAVIAALLISGRDLNPVSLILFVIGFALLFFYAVPPFRLVYSGYGELIQAYFVASLTPFIAYALQSGDLHRLLWLLTQPLTALYLATTMALTLHGTPEQIRLGRQNIWSRIGWQRGFMLHNLLVLGAFVLLGVFSLLGLPWLLTWPGLLGLPFGVLQVVHVNQIADGDKPRWRLLSLLALASLGIAAYSITLTLWIH